MIYGTAQRPSVLQSKPTLYGDISKNHQLSIKTFPYWTLLGFSHGFYFLMGEAISQLGNGEMLLHNTELTLREDYPNEHQSKRGQDVCGCVLLVVAWAVCAFLCVPQC